MKKLCITMLLVVACFTSAQAGSKVRVLTSLDVVESMAEVLTHGTSLEVLNVIPQGYSMQGQAAYLKKHQKAFFATAAKADAVLTVGSAWAVDPLYKWARRGNIRIVEIDTAKPLDGYGAGVPLIKSEGKYIPYVWRSPANLTRMASIAADDLARLVPGDAERIKSNLKRLQTGLFTLRSAFEATFSELDFVDLAALTPNFDYLLDEFGLEVHGHFLKPEREWTESDVASVSARLRKDMVKGVVCPWEPEGKPLQAIKKGGATPVVLRKYVRRDGVEPLTSLTDWYEENLSRLVHTLED